MRQEDAQRIPSFWRARRPRPCCRANSAERQRPLLLMWQAGGISWETFYYLMQQGEWTRPDVEAEAELALIRAEQAALAPEPAPEPAVDAEGNPIAPPAGAAAA